MIPRCPSATSYTHSSLTAISALREGKNSDLKASSSMSSANKSKEGSVDTTDLPRKATSLKTEETWHKDTAIKFKRLN